MASDGIRWHLSDPVIKKLCKAEGEGGERWDSKGEGRDGCVAVPRTSPHINTYQYISIHISR